MHALGPDPIVHHRTSRYIGVFMAGIGSCHAYEYMTTHFQTCERTLLHHVRLSEGAILHCSLLVGNINYITTIANPN
jgi:hypothetical protein